MTLTMTGIVLSGLDNQVKIIIKSIKKFCPDLIFDYQYKNDHELRTKGLI